MVGVDIAMNIGFGVPPFEHELIVLGMEWCNGIKFNPLSDYSRFLRVEFSQKEYPKYLTYLSI